MFLWPSNAATWLSDIVSLLPSCFVSLLFLHSHNWRLPLCKLWHMCRAGHYHDLPHHDRNSGFWLPTKEWDCHDPRWYCVCLHPTKVFNAWSSGRFWYVVSLTHLHGVYSKLTHQGDILGTRYFILTSIGRFSFFQCRFCWAAAVPRLSFDFRACVTSLWSSTYPSCQRPWQWQEFTYLPTQIIHLVDRSLGENEVCFFNNALAKRG